MVCLALVSCSKPAPMELAKNSSTSSVSAASTPQARAPQTSPADALPTTHCFSLTENKDTVSAQITVGKDNKVTGKLYWNPYQKDSAYGVLSGVKSNDTITALYNYMIEGSKQAEEKVFVVRPGSLDILSGPLDDKNGVMVIKDITAAKVSHSLLHTDCGALKFPSFSPI